MGVEGLWKLLDQANCGNPVSLESLENIVLAIDCSIWLNQIIKGTRDENDYLLNVFRRICKLMHYKIKPVFVFDGGVPELKRKTIQSRKFRNDDLVNKQLDRLKTFVKDRHNVNIDLKGTNLKSTKLSGFRDDNNLFYLDDNLDMNDLSEESDEFNEKDEIILNGKQINIEDHSNSILNTLKCKNVLDVDTDSDEFKKLPPEFRHEILIEIKEMKKFNVAERNQPEEINDYSSYQIGKLVKSYDIQKEIEKTRKEMVGQRGQTSDEKFKEEYEKYISTRIASDEFTNLVFTKKKAPEVKPVLIKSSEKPKKNYDSNIYGTVEEYDYGITDEVDPKARNCLINERMIKKIEIKKELEDDSSTDDSDFITVQEGTIDDNSIDNLDFDLSNIHPLLLLNEKKVLERNETQSIGNRQDKSTNQTAFKSPNKRTSDLLSSNTIESEMKKTALFKTSVSNEKINLFEESFNVTINVNNEGTNDFPKSVTHSPSKSNKSETICLDNSDSEIFNDVTEFEHDLNKYLDQIESRAKDTLEKSNRADELQNKIDQTVEIDETNEDKPSTSTDSVIASTKQGLSIDFLESEDNALTDLIDTKLIDKITESPTKSRQTSPQKSNSQNTPKKDLKIVQLKPPKHDQLMKNKIKPKPQDLSETLQLVRDIKKVKRQTNTVENSIIEETKELLNLFGIPFVISPMEAEAQCAILEQLNLTNGTITDDGDVWLFGAKTVYKNFYNQSKFVIKYTSKEIKERLKLTRENLICFAMLTGSDYTDGIRGVGPVTALEIISEFNGDRMKPLIDFKSFWQDKKDGKPKKFNKVRAKFLKYEVPKQFPNERVFDAYTNPEVDSSSEKFKFGKPDLDLLRRFTSEKFNWSQDKQDKELLPLFKRINDSSTQLKISSFFQVVAKNREPDKLESKRLRKALEKKISGAESDVVLKSKNGTSKAKKSHVASKKGVKKTDAKKINNEPKLITLKSKVTDQRKKKTDIKASVFDKEIKISQYFNTEKPRNVNKAKLDDEIICLSNDSD